MKTHPSAALGPRRLLVSSIAGLARFAIGCRTTTQDVMMYGGQLPRLERVIVYDFTSAAENVQLGSGAIARLKEELRSVGGTSDAEQRTNLEQQIAPS